MNKEELATNKLRRDALEILEAGLTAIDTEKILKRKISIRDGILEIDGYFLNLKSYENIFLVGIGKCAFQGAKVIEEILGSFLTNGAVIDIKPTEEAVGLKKCKYFAGTHPYPSEQNISATKEILEIVKSATDKDLIISLISGGGSSLFDIPTIPVDKLVEITKTLTAKGADIYELNTVRKHLSQIKGGQFAKLCFPAQVISLLFSDVLGNDISVIASGPTVLDNTAIDDAKNILNKYEIYLADSPSVFAETPKDQKYFEKVKNILISSNADALEAMEEKAGELGYDATIETDRFSGDAVESGRKLAERETKPTTCVLFGGETTVKIPEEHGKGGRNQAMALSALSYMKKNSVLVCAASDGWDNTDHAGAVSDCELFEKSRALNLNPDEFLQKSDSYNFFKTAGGAISTGRLESNVSDLVIILNE